MAFTDLLIFRIHDPEGLKRKLKRYKKQELIETIEYLLDKFQIVAK